MSPGVESYDSKGRIESILMKFCREQQTTRGASDFPSDVKITRIVTEHYSYDGEESYQTTAITRNDNLGFDLSCVEFVANGKSGYAMVSDTPGIEGVYLLYTKLHHIHNL